MRIKTLLVPAVCALLAACGSTTTTPDKASTTPASEPAKTAETKVARHPWGSFKVGSYVVTKNTTLVAGQKMTTEIKTTLTALSADKATVEMATTAMGNTSKTTMDFPLTTGPTPSATPTGTVATPNAEVKTSEETITVAGKSLNCKVTTATSETGGMKSESTTWMSDDVPGFVVKTVVKTTGPSNSETTSEVTDFKAS